MNKQFLDFLYSQKADISNEIQELNSIKDFDSELSQQLHGNSLRDCRVRLAMIDAIIINYLELHSK